MKPSKRNSVKEAFDNLPCGVCFFDRNGMTVMCNHLMTSLFFDLAGSDMQNPDEMRALIKGKTREEIGEAGVFFSGDGKAWKFSEETVTLKSGEEYTQITASDITELYRRRTELEEDNRILKEYGERMRRLSANILSLIRDEETLNMKMRIHDDIGRSVIATRRFLRGDSQEEPDLTEWQNAVHILKHDNEIAEIRNTQSSLETAARGLGIELIREGDLPSDAAASSVLTAAVRECMTNSVRHAGATELRVVISCDGTAATAVITDNGKAPPSEITEGGGLSSLRAKVEKHGGTMKIRSGSGVELTVSVPLKKESLL